MATHKFHRMHIQALTILVLLQLTFMPPKSLEPHLPDTNMAIGSSSGEQAVVMVEADDFLQRFTAEVCLHCLQILYFEFNPFRVNFCSRFLLCWSSSLPLSRSLLLGTCNTNNLPGSRLLCCCSLRQGFARYPRLALNILLPPLESTETPGMHHHPQLDLGVSILTRTSPLLSRIQTSMLPPPHT